MIETILQWLGASDQLIATMGPTVAILVAVAAGGAVAQTAKFPLSRVLPDDGWFSWATRAVAVVSTAAFTYGLAPTLPGAVVLAVGFLQLGIYHGTLALIRKFWPWLECHPAVGSIAPPVKAYVAAAERDPTNGAGA